MAAMDVIKNNPNANIYLIVPTERLRDVGWEDEFDKWEQKEIYDGVYRYCYVSCNKVKNQEIDLVILDEAHNITELRFEFFKNNNVKRVIALTATIPRDEEKRKMLNEVAPVCFEYPLEQGVKDGVVSPYKITVIQTSLDSNDRYVEAGNKKKRFFQTEEGYYKWLTKVIARMLYSKDKKQKEAAKFQILRRTRFIYNLKSKLKAAEILLEHIIPDYHRTLIFCGSIAQALELCDYRYYSKPNEKKNPKAYKAYKGEESLELFVNEKINRLSCVNRLNEGHNIPNLDSALIVQLNSNELDLIQRIGRIVRFREGHIADIYIIMCQDTQDEKWTFKALEKFDSNNIEFVTLKSLKWKLNIS